MRLRMMGALVLAGLVAGCSGYPGNSTSDYAMATPEPVMAPQPQPEAPPLAQTPPQGKYGVQVAAPRSVEEARAVIDSMRAKYPSQLGNQWAAIHPVTLPNGTFYRVVIGPLPSEKLASQLCSSLKAQGAPCFLRGT